MQRILDLITDPDFWETMLNWSKTSGIKILIIIVATTLVNRFAKRIVRKVIAQALKKDYFANAEDELKREDTLVGIISAILRIAAWAFAIMMILTELRVDTSPLLAAAASLGIAFGFGAQSLIKDFVSGLFIIMENQYRIGDVVSIAGVSGVVTAISIRTTVLRDLDGNEHHVPNGSIDVTTNRTMEYSGINMNIGVAYDTDIEKVKKVIDKVGSDLAKDAKWGELINEAPHFVRVNNFNASDVELKILGKVKAGKQWTVAGEFRQRLKAAFDKNGIEIPFPQRVIHTKEVTED